MSKNDGGPAFPELRREWVELRKGGCYRYALAGGATLRDYFAAKAMQGLIAREGFDGEKEDYAETAYGYADAMLAERNKP